MRSIRRRARWRAAAVLLAAGLLAPVVAVPAGAQTPPPSVDYDDDDDGLIEIASLPQLNAVRWDLDGDGAADVYPPSKEGRTGHDPDGAAKLAAAFPNAAAGMGCPTDGCDGYELAADLDFDTNGNGRADSGDEFWNGGRGWVPLMGGEAIYGSRAHGRFIRERRGSVSYWGLEPHSRARAFSGVFEGNGRTIANLYINDPRRWYVGLFGYITRGHVRNVGLSVVNADTRVQGYQFVGALAGSAERALVSGVWSDVDVSGDADAVGGLIGNLLHGVMISESYSTGNVRGDDGAVGGLIGALGGSTLVASYATGDVAAWNSVGGGVGLSSEGRGQIVSATYATGSVRLTGTDWRREATYAGGLFGQVWAQPLGAPWTSLYANYSTGQVPKTARAGGLSGNCNDMSGSRARALGYWDTESSGRTAGPACGVGYTTAQLQAPTGYEGIYSTWNVDVDGDGSADDPWDFGTSSEYPVLKYCAAKPGIDTADGLPYCPLQPWRQRGQPEPDPPVPDPPAVVLPVVSVAGDGSVGEGSFAVFTLTVAPPPSGGLVVQVTVRSSDFGVLSQTRVVRVPVSGSAKVYVATAVDYDSVDGWVTVSVDDDPADVDAYAVSATQGAATVTVLDDD